MWLHLTAHLAIFRWPHWTFSKIFYKNINWILCTQCWWCYHVKVLLRIFLFCLQNFVLLLLTVKLDFTTKRFQNIGGEVFIMRNSSSWYSTELRAHMDHLPCLTYQLSSRHTPHYTLSSNNVDNKDDDDDDDEETETTSKEHFELRSEFRWRRIHINLSQGMFSRCDKNLSYPSH